MPAVTVHRDLRRFGGEGVLRGHGGEQCRRPGQQLAEFLPDPGLTGEGLVQRHARRRSHGVVDELGDVRRDLRTGGLDDVRHPRGESVPVVGQGDRHDLLDGPVRVAMLDHRTPALEGGRGGGKVAADRVIHHVVSERLRDDDAASGDRPLRHLDRAEGDAVRVERMLTCDDIVHEQGVLQRAGHGGITAVAGTAWSRE